MSRRTGVLSRPARQGLGDPLLVVFDGAPRIIRAIEECFPRAMRRLSGAFARDRRAIGERHPRRLRRSPAERARLFRGRFRGCIAHLRLPVTHRRFFRTTNLLERLFVEERRRLNIIPTGFGEKPGLKLRFGALIHAILAAADDEDAALGTVTFAQYRHFFGAISVRLPDPQIIDFARLSRRTPGAFDK